MAELGNSREKMDIQPAEALSLTAEKEESPTESRNSTSQLLYGVEDVPPFLLTFFIGLQQVAMSISGSIAVPLIVAEVVCIPLNSPDSAYLVCTFLLMCGLSSLLQCTIGVRLPIIQGGCAKFIPATIALMTLESLRCSPEERQRVHVANNQTENNTTFPQDAMHLVRLREIQGGIILASLAEFVFASSGLLGIVLQYIGPITIMPTIALVGLSLFGLAGGLCEVHWGIAALTVGLILLFSLYLSNIRVPFPACSRSKGFYITWSPIFKLLPVVLAVAISWALSFVLTATGVFTNDPDDKGYQARTDANLGSLQRMPWFYVAYPGQWGRPTFSVASFLGMLVATIASMVESIGDYYACAATCGLPAPPAHAMNRGIAVEGLGGILSGLFGSGGSTTSYSQNVGAIGFTRAGSRRAFQAAGLIFMFCGIFGKFGAVMTMMPKPILGATLIVGLGMVAAVGIANLQFVDMRSPRNQCIIGISLMLGLVVPHWSKNNPQAINTGNTELDQSIKVLLQTSMFVGGVIAFMLDNTVPGSRKERGLAAMKQVDDSQEDSNDVKAMTGTQCETYNLPLVSGWLRRRRWARYVPTLPPFDDGLMKINKCLCCSCK